MGHDVVVVALAGGAGAEREDAVAGDEVGALAEAAAGFVGVGAGVVGQVEDPGDGEVGVGA